MRGKGKRGLETAFGACPLLRVGLAIHGCRCTGWGRFPTCSADFIGALQQRTASASERPSSPLPADLPIHGIRCQIDLARPCHSSMIHKDPFEKRRFTKRRQDAREILRSELHPPVACGAHRLHVPLCAM
jgi:hypothetical protein